MFAFLPLISCPANPFSYAQKKTAIAGGFAQIHFGSSRLIPFLQRQLDLHRFSHQMPGLLIFYFSRHRFQSQFIHGSDLMAQRNRFPVQPGYLLRQQNFIGAYFTMGAFQTG